MTEPHGLTERERQILRLVATGASNKEIAQMLEISPNTVKVHMRNIFEKIGAASRTEATLIALRMDGLNPPPQALNAPKPETEAIPPAPAVPAMPPLARRKGLWIVAALSLLGLMLAVWAIWQPFKAPAPTQPLPTAAPLVRWHSQPDLPEARAASAAAVVGGQLYLIGGQTASGPTASVLRYTAASGAWQALADKPTPVSGVQAAVLGERVYLPGGCDAKGQPTRQLEIYDPRLDTWTSGTALPTAVCRAALAVLEGQLYLMGGWNGTSASQQAWRYDPQSDQWSALRALPSARMDATAATLEGALYLMGGQSDQPLDQVWAYFPARDMPGQTPWEARAPLPAPRTQASAVSLAGMLYLLGGSSPTQPDPAPLLYLPNGDQWLRFEAAPHALGDSPALAALDTRLYVMGGQKAGQLSATVQTYQAVYTILFPVVP